MITIGRHDDELMYSGIVGNTQKPLLYRCNPSALLQAAGDGGEDRQSN